MLRKPDTSAKVLGSKSGLLKVSEEKQPTLWSFGIPALVSIVQ